MHTHPGSFTPLTLAIASPEDREFIYRSRHEVYAHELGQHLPNAEQRLRDTLDDSNVYLVAKAYGRIHGYISITPPQAGGYSIEKYVSRDALPFSVDNRLYEVRLLTVLRPHRRSDLAALLMYAAFRWVEAHGGTRIVAIGRREILQMYLKIGFQLLGRSIQSGSVTFELMCASIAAAKIPLQRFVPILRRLQKTVDWQLSFPFFPAVSCFHGGSFFRAIGPKFDALQRSGEIINADVLDAWFPPSPGVLDTIHEYLPWLTRTSPPAACEGFIESVAMHRGVQPENILPGAGSSDLIFRAFRYWLSAESRVLILDPMYGEYAHVLEKVIGCHVDRLTLSKADDYRVKLATLRDRLSRRNYDLVVLVNPNSPTGQHIDRAELLPLLQSIPSNTRIWIDETYIDYAGAEQSMEEFAAASENVLVCKSMSKVYALSGMRAGYLCAGSHQLEALRAITPPWIISLPAQVACVRALEDYPYYAARYRETHDLRGVLRTALERLGWEVTSGRANFLLAHLPTEGPGVSSLLSLCQEDGLFLRDASTMGASLGRHALRIAVKDAPTTQKMLGIIEANLSRLGGFHRPHLFHKRCTPQSA